MTPYARGYQARLKNVLYLDNPYLRNVDWEAWNNGWNTADDDLWCADANVSY